MKPLVFFGQVDIRPSEKPPFLYTETLNGSHVKSVRDIIEHLKNMEQMAHIKITKNSVLLKFFYFFLYFVHVEYETNKLVRNFSKCSHSNKHPLEVEMNIFRAVWFRILQYHVIALRHHRRVYKVKQLTVFKMLFVYTQYLFPF